MGLAKLKEYISVEEYLAGEKVSEIKHEYISGVVYPMYNEVGMAGASDRHNQIAGRIYARLLDKTDDSECQVFIKSMKLQIDAETFYYPDVLVACDKPSSYYRREPILIVEILSPSTERIDKNEKLFVYQQITGLQEYLIVAQDKMRIEFHQRQSDGNWMKEVFSQTDESIILKSVDLVLTLKEVYRRVDFEKI